MDALRITHAMLQEHGACSPGLERFRELHGEELLVTSREQAIRLAGQWPSSLDIRILSDALGIPPVLMYPALEGVGLGLALREWRGARIWDNRAMSHALVEVE